MTTHAKKITGAARVIVDAVGNVDWPSAAIDDREIGLSHLPGSTGFIGGLLFAWRGMRRGVAFTREYAESSPPVSVFRFGRDRVVMVTDYDAVERITTNADGLWSAALGWRGMLDGFESAEELHMLLTMDGDMHRELRRALQPAFSGAALRGYLRIAEPMYAAAVDRWATEGRVRFKAEVRRLLARSALAIFLGVTKPKDAALFDRDMQAVWNAMLFATSRNQWSSLAWRRGLRAWGRLRERLLALIARRRADADSRGDDLLSELVTARTSLPGVEDDDAIVQVIMNVMIAAFDTTASAATSMAYALAAHPEWQTRLREEIAAADPETAPHQTKAYPLMDRVWKETLRRYPITGVLMRRALKDTEVAGYEVPAGALVWASTGAAALDPEVWTEPTRFDPERFSPERAEHRRRARLYAPFGLGPHACIGMQLAAFEAKALFGMLLRDHRIRLRKPYEARHSWVPLGIVSGAVDLVVEPA